MDKIAFIKIGGEGIDPLTPLPRGPSSYLRSVLKLVPHIKRDIVACYNNIFLALLTGVERFPT
jgi:hypothetical protein